MRTVLVENYHVRYQVLGEGEPLILVHGLSGSMRWWNRNVQALAQDHRVYLIDLPGFGTMSPLLVWGEHDTLVPPSIGKILCTSIANSYLVILSDASHVSMYDQSEQFDRLAEQFLQGQPHDAASSC